MGRQAGVVRAHPAQSAADPSADDQPTRTATDAQHAIWISRSCLRVPKHDATILDDNPADSVLFRLQYTPETHQFTLTVPRRTTKSSA